MRVACACLWLAVCLASLFRVSSAEAAGKLTIKKLILLPAAGNDSVTLVNICFTGANETLLQNATQIILNCFNNSATTTSNAHATDYQRTDNMTCSNHEVPLHLFGITVTCVLTVENKNASSHYNGVATVEVPADGVCSPVYAWDEQNVLGAMCIIAEMVNMTLIDSSTYVSYFLFDAQERIPTVISPCDEVKNLDSDGDENVTLCTGISATNAPNETVVISNVNLNYNGYVLSVKGDLPKFSLRKTDMVLWEDGIAETNTSVAIGGNDGKDLHQFIVMEYIIRKGAERSSIGVHKDYGVNVEPLTSTILEVYWTRNTESDDSPYSMYMHIEPAESQDSFNKVTVECTEGLNCYGYFTGVNSEETYTVTVESANGENSVTACSVNLQDAKQREGIHIRRLEYEWSEGDDSVNVTVCFRHRGTRLQWLETYELKLIDRQGRWQHSNGAFEADLNLLCFRTMTIDTRHFQMTDKVWVTVVRRDGDSRAVLASAGSEMVAPEVERITPQTIRVSWSNPSGDTFSIKRRGESTQLATSQACHTCTHDIASTAPGEAEHLTFVVETQDAASLAEVESRSDSPRPLSGNVSKS